MNAVANAINNIAQQLSSQAKLVAVSKRQPNEKIILAYESGLKRFGENYVQELVNKAEALPKDIEWHMIGHLQSNKVKYIAPFVSMIHSVDSFKLLKEINKQAEKHNRVINCLLQMHIAQEDTKTGMSETELIALLENSELSALEHIKIQGLMGMSTFTDNQDQIESEFSTLKRIFDSINSNYINLNLTELSMGMSGDWPLALKHGSTLIRVGSAIFGNRA